MKIGRRKIYWDTTCWLAWLNNERDTWSANVLVGIQDVVYEVELNGAILFSSSIARGEIFVGAMTTDQKTRYANLLRRTNVQEISADTRIMDRASAIREYHQARGQKVHLPDATHLATAVLYRADEFHTMDGLQKGGSKLRKLLALNGDVGGFPLKIVHPYPRNAIPAELVTVKGPLYERKETELSQNQPEAPDVHRSGSQDSDSQTARENEEQKNEDGET